jgi:cytochrome c peroxidase
MEDKELIAKLSYLKQIKPKNDWVLLTRQRIVGQDLQEGRFWAIVKGIGDLVGNYMEKPAVLIPLLACMVAGGVLWQGVAESLPGDTLYPLRSAVEKAPLRFSADEERPIREFALAQQSLADLKMVAEQNKIKNLPSAIQEFEANASKISEGFIATVENQPEKALQASRQMVQLQKDKSEVERILGTRIGEEQEEEVENATKKLVEYEISYLETRSLTEAQKELFESVKALVQEGDYAKALEIIWELSQNP